MTTLGEVIKTLRTKKGLTQSELAEAVGLQQPAIQKLEDGSRAGTSKIVKIAIALDVSPIYLETLDDRYAKLKAFDTPSSDNLTGNDAYIPILNISNSITGELYPPNHEKTIDFISISKLWINTQLPHITSIGNIALISGIGNSMKPTIYNDDLLLIDKGVKNISPNTGIYLFSINEHLFIKRLSINPITKVISVKSDNELGDSWDIPSTHEKQLTIHGKIIYSWNGKHL